MRPRIVYTQILIQIQLGQQKNVYFIIIFSLRVIIIPTLGLALGLATITTYYNYKANANTSWYGIMCKPG